VAKRDYYDILGIGRDADDQQIKSAYRKLALQHHPDRNPDNPDSEEKFKEAAEAYSVLTDGQKRAAYDRFGHAGVQGAATQGFESNAFADFGDILGDFFGLGDMLNGGRRRSRAQRGEDVRYDLEIGFEEGVFGMTAEIQVPRMEACDHCNSTGAEPAPPATAAARSSISRASFPCGGPATRAAAAARSCAILAGSAMARAIARWCAS
jgi:molecular chaperone DnaJ